MCATKPSFVLKYVAILLATFVLTACGGGGGGGGGSAAAPPASTPPAADPVPTIPTRPQTNPYPANPTPGAPASTNPAASSAMYALGAPDRWFMPSGGFELANNGYAVTISDSFRYPSGIHLLHRRIQGSASGNQRFVTQLPPAAVREAWRDGWTGRGVNILILDDFGVSARPPSGNENRHGYAVALAAKEIAIGANYYSKNAELSSSGLRYDAGGLRRMRDDALVGDNARVDVMNLSFDTGLAPVGTVYTRTDTNNYFSGNRALSDDLTGIDLPNAMDAVIVKGAGNDGGDAGLSLLNFAVLDSPLTGPRALLVGAFSSAGIHNCGEGSRCGTSISTNSNTPGSDTKIQQRFLVEYGGSPVRQTVYLCDRSSTSSCQNRQTMATRSSQGTSFAAPRVAGYAALVRHKFPNLSGAQTASILLDTATYEGLSGSDPATYGQGRVDIGAALAPVGSLR